MTAEQFMLQYNSLSTTAKKQFLQERSPPITQAVPLSSGPDLPHPDTNDLDMTIPIENNQQEDDEQQNELVPNRRRRMDSMIPMIHTKHQELLIGDNQQKLE
ncbi:hypothetical protein BDEG_24686 [Batrachochytrium dendrobatidis JEL423]|uniref:Uncharacterized protein n=1 Tax=Batrachochytrium dendrobatidis (strain JEL423) TaxID=403673 RepID=A0A177WLQ3_BATDL|nr:hypothetical protein BDEG_24686 [Batrachochytrium dendrobatidis JEL423]